MDVIVVGGGMVGASFALALADSGLRVLVIESVVPGAGPQPSFDDRTTALGNASRRIFQSLGVWQDIVPAAAAIRAIHVSDAGRFGFARLNAAEQGIDAFGYVVTNRVIGAALWSKLAAAKGVCVRAPARAENLEITSDGVRLTVIDDRSGEKESVSARLVVAADGAHSVVRAAASIESTVEDYDQVAMIANLGTDRPHDGTAYERFTATGPLALLPLHDGSHGVVWSVQPAEAERILALDDKSFLAELQRRFGWRAGRFTHVGRRASYPLKLTRAATTTATRSVLIGNAAQALHPVAGQGFNLGLRDAAMLAEVLAGAVGEGLRTDDAPPVDVGSVDLLTRFEAWRSGDRSGVMRFTDGLIRVFGDTRPGMGLARNFGLLLFDLTPPAKSALARVSAGFAGPTPRLARGLAVR